MVPTAFVFLREFPLRQNGKIDFSALTSVQHNDTRQSEPVALTPVGTRVLEILRHALQYNELGPDDDFFQAGGDLLLAIQVLFQLENAFSISISSGVMAESITARRLGGILEQEVLRGSPPAGIVELRKGTGEKNLFCIPGMSGTAIGIRPLAQKISNPRTIYAFELHNLDVDPLALEFIEETAKVLIQTLRQVQPHGPYALVGYSYGGNIVVEMARQLIADGLSIDLALIIDAYVPGSTRFVSGLKKLATHLRIITQSKFSDACDHVLSRIRRRIIPSPQGTGKVAPPQSMLQTPTAQRIAKTSEHCHRAFANYRPTPFPGRIALVAATDLNDWVEIVDPSEKLGWGAICQGGVDVISIGCKHLELFKEPHVTKLASYLDGMMSVIGE